MVSLWIDWALAPWIRRTVSRTVFCISGVSPVSPASTGHGEYLARISLWIDFGFMASYGAFFALACATLRDFAAGQGLRRLTALGAVATGCAVVKFVLIVPAIAYALAGLVAWLRIGRS